MNVTKCGTYVKGYVNYYIGIKFKSSGVKNGIGNTKTSPKSLIRLLCAYLMMASWKHFPALLDPLWGEQTFSCITDLLCRGHKGPVMRNADAFFIVNTNNLLNEQSSYRWVEMPWRSCGVTLMTDKVWDEFHSVDGCKRHKDIIGSYAVSTPVFSVMHPLSSRTNEHLDPCHEDTTVLHQNIGIYFCSRYFAKN